MTMNVLFITKIILPKIIACFELLTLKIFYIATKQDIKYLIYW